MLKYLIEFISDDADRDIKTFLLTAAGASSIFDDAARRIMTWLLTLLPLSDRNAVQARSDHQRSRRRREFNVFSLALSPHAVGTNYLMSISVVHGRSRRRVLDGSGSLDGLHGRNAVADHASGRDWDRAVRVLPGSLPALPETDENLGSTQFLGLDLRSH